MLAMQAEKKEPHLPTSRLKALTLTRKGYTGPYRRADYEHNHFFRPRLGHSEPFQ
jgi:hypothetical protein